MLLRFTVDPPVATILIVLLQSSAFMQAYIAKAGTSANLEQHVLVSASLKMLQSSGGGGRQRVGGGHSPFAQH